LRNVAREFQTMKKWILSNVPTFTSTSTPQKSEQTRESPGDLASRVKTQPPQRKQVKAKPLVELGPPTPGKPMILNQGKLQELPAEVQSRLERKPVNMVVAPKDFAAKEMEPRYVPAERKVAQATGKQTMNTSSEQRTRTPNLQPYVQALSNSQSVGYQNSDVARFKASAPLNGSRTTMNKSDQVVSGSQRKYIARNHRNETADAGSFG